MLPKLIAIAGRAGAGKDTLADALVSAGGVKYRFADPLKSGICAMFGWTREQLEDRTFKEAPIDWLGKSPRQLMQILGTEWGRDLVNPQLWVKLFEQAYLRHAHHDGATPFIVPDCRFEDEARAVKALGGVVVEVLRPGVAAVAGHRSEAGLPSKLIDVILVNNAPTPALFAVSAVVDLAMYGTNV